MIEESERDLLKQRRLKNMSMYESKYRPNKQYWYNELDLLKKLSLNEEYKSKYYLIIISESSQMGVSMSLSAE